MRTADFTFDLPDELIARVPAKRRRDSRLMVVDRAQGLFHSSFSQLLDLLEAGDLLVFNNTRVIPARFFGSKTTGGRLEILLERILEPNLILAHVKSSKPLRDGVELSLEHAEAVVCEGRRDDLFLLRSQRPWLDLAEEQGHMPLPPYIDRPDSEEDRQRYQTVYASQPGAVAAPTAGLHFDPELLDELQQRGIQRGELTLHVGAGTFQPVRVDDVQQHRMHSEWMCVDQQLVDQIRRTRNNGGRVVAVGTTSVRALESLALQKELKPWEGETDIFIYPGFEFGLVDAMITNFHLPESTLLMLVSAFAGQEEIREAYNEAVRQRYRFFSYGDAMFLSRNPDVPQRYRDNKS